MAEHKAESWTQGEHLGEKREILGKVEGKLEGREAAGELPELIQGIAKYRYPQDGEPNVRREKKQCFDTALKQTESACKSDNRLAKYGVRKEDIMEWCKIPILEETSGDQWKGISRRGSFDLGANLGRTPNAVAETVMALKFGLGKLGITPELAPQCSMTVDKRDPKSFLDRFTGLPKPSGNEDTYLVNLAFKFKTAKVRLTYDSSDPRVVVIDGLVALSDHSAAVIEGLLHLDAASRITRFDGPREHLLPKGGSIDNFLRLIKLAGEDKPGKNGP